MHDLFLILKFWLDSYDEYGSWWRGLKFSLQFFGFDNIHVTVKARTQKVASYFIFVYQLTIRDIIIGIVSAGYVKYLP